MTDIIDSFNEFRREEGLPEIGTAWEVCSLCHGEGELGGYPGVYTPDDFREDPDFFEDYMRHRRPCEECNGRTTVRVVDHEKADFDTSEAFYAYADDVASSYAIERQERAMGA